MSKIQGMSIQGVRSFSPDGPQKIILYCPLTLILGQNGCGKTTIIEALKYVTTGDLPPGSNRGSSFVHDPKMTSKSSVRGQVKLLFQDTRGREMVITRSFEAIQRIKRIEFKTLDATIKECLPGGEEVSMSRKCADMDALMSTYLGVEKPILNNVIFCHQEESNWPLDEGKRVKEKFDAIFSATQYIKCSDAIKKLRQDMRAKVKSMRDILVEMKKWKEELHRKRALLQKTQKQQTVCKNEKEKLSQELKPILERLRKISSVESNIAKIDGEISGKQHQLRSLRESQAELRASLSVQITYSDDELDFMIQDFQQNLSQKEKELSKVKCEMDQLERQVQGQQQVIAEAQRNHGELNAIHNTYKNNVYKRNEKIAPLVVEFAFSEFDDINEFSNDQVEAVLSQLLTLANETRRTTQKKKQEFEQKEAALQSETDNLRSQEATLEHDIKTKGSQLDEINRNIKRVRQSLMRNESHLAVANLEEIKDNLAEIEKKITEEEKKINMPEITEEINYSKKKKQELEHSLSDIKRTVAKLNRQAEVRSQYDIHLKEKKELENKVDFLKRKDGDELEHLLGEIPEENIKNKLDACISNIRRVTGDTRQAAEQLSKRKAQLDITVKSHKSQIDKKEIEIRDLENMIESTCQGSDLDSALEKSKDVKEKLTRERGHLSSSITVLKRFIDKLEQDDCCPLCHRDFIKKDEVQQLIEELESKVSSVPGKLESVKKRLLEEENRHEQMIQLKPQRDRANKAKQELNRLKSQMEADMNEGIKVAMELESKQEFLDVTLSDEETARRIQPDVITIENHLRKIKTLRDQTEDLHATLGIVEGGLSMEEATNRQAEFDEEYRRVFSRLEELQEMVQDHKELIQSLKDRRIRLSDKQLNLKTKIQETEKLENEVKQLEQSRVVLEEERERASQEVAPYKYKLYQKLDEKIKITKEKEAFIDQQNCKVNEINEKHRSIRELQRSIMQYVSRGGEEQLKESEDKVATLQNKVTSLQTQKRTLEEQNRRTEREITSHKERKRNLDDEKKIREKEIEAIAVQKDITRLEESVREFNVETLVDEKHELEIRLSQIQNKKASMDGRLEEISDNIRELEDDLKRKEIRDAEKNYREKVLELKCTDIAADDLNKFYKALDTAIMRFHQGKMETINRIIRELWRTTYRGNDIDYIEIKTDESESKGADRRRMYNYRVVMVRNEVEMDMRGRCSAGQKVLASLLIRMALAETFSSKCGILALDEPTTNLDRENIEALAEALLQVVRNREHQANLQLIVITHDSIFLEQMSRCEFIDSYYTVKRDQLRGNSLINENSVKKL